MRPPAGYWPLAKWIKRVPTMFANDDQVTGALIFAFQQYMDGCGDSLPEWIGITPEEHKAWEESRRRGAAELPEPLQRKRGRQRGAP